MKHFSPLWSLIPGAALIAGCGSQPKDKTSEHSPQKPNVVYLIADDLGIGDLSCYGATKVSTPNIDRLAGQGMQFTNAYATSSTSTPSRFGLLTGMYPWRQKNTGIAPGNSELIIDTACITMADMFKEEGYATAAVGKWHLGLGPKGGTDFNHSIKPNTQDIGFDYEYIIPATVDRVPCVFVENGHVVGLDPNDPITVSYDHKVGDWPTGLENPELVKMKPSQGHNNTIINGIPRIGWMTGGKSALWTDEDIADNTIFVFCSDNGPVIDDGYQDQARELLNGHTPMKHYRGGKYSAFDAGTRIPFIVRWPNGIKPGKQQAPFSMIDVYASLAALLNHPLEAGIAPDSRDQLNNFLGTDTAGCDYIVQQNLDNTLSIIQGDWKYIEPSDKPALEYWTKIEMGNAPQPQLYNLSIDPSEKDNVAEAHPGKVKTLSALLEEVKEAKNQSERE